jgi:CheY-like chemotaxis protein
MKPPNNKEILIISNDENMRCILCHALKDSGYSCNCVSSGKSLCNLASEYSLIVISENTKITKEMKKIGCVAFGKSFRMTDLLDDVDRVIGES